MCENSHLALVWRVKKPQGNYVRPNKHAYYELVYYASGSGVGHIDGNRYEFQKDHFVLIPPKTKHDELLTADSDIICLGFTCEKPLAACLREDRSGIILSILEVIVEECANQTTDYEDMVSAKLCELCIYLSRASEKQKAKDKSLEYIVNYINENYFEKIHMADCARQLQMSYSHFQNKFRQATGLSPKNYLLKRRLSAARHLLLYSELNCTEIALRCGFSTSALFSLLFRKEYGVTPTEYRHAKRT